MNNKKLKQKAKNYYDQEAEDYISQYQRSYDQYPANLIRIKFIIERLGKSKVKTILDVGCGTAGPMIKLLKKGFEVTGFDFSEDMVTQGKKELVKAGYDSELIKLVYLEDTTELPGKKFDAVIALGVFPHLLNERKALVNIRKMLNPGGLVFIEFRNDLFAAFSFNKYSLEFFLNRLIDVNSLPKHLGSGLIDFYSNKLKVDYPTNVTDGRISYTDILANFQNPLTIGKELFNSCGFSVTDIHFYHFHALPPIFEKKYPKIFRELSLKLEKTNDWKGYLMASAFVVEAKKPR